MKNGKWKLRIMLSLWQAKEFIEIYAKYIDEQMDCCGSGLIHSLHREYMHDNVESIDEEAMKSYAIAMESNGERLSIRRLDWIPSPRKIILTLWTKS
ncbi:hypothetical protein NH340_JMT05654, partial [Sarcoptes scabiei]